MCNPKLTGSQFSLLLSSTTTSMVQNSLLCAGMPLRNYSITHAFQSTARTKLKG